MQEQNISKQPQSAEPAILIHSAGLSAEARQMLDAVARRAYEIFESKGRIGGRDLENWFEAESQLFGRSPIDVKETADGVTVLADVRHFSPRDLEVDLEPRRVTIIGKHQSQSGQPGGGSSAQATNLLLRRLEMPMEIDTTNATASLNRGVLQLDVKKLPQAKAKGAQAGAGSSRNVA